MAYMVLKHIKIISLQFQKQKKLLLLQDRKQMSSAGWRKQE